MSERVARLNLPRPLNRHVGTAVERADKATAHDEIVEAFEIYSKTAALALCAWCRHHGLDSAALKEARLKLVKPSFGHWLGLFRECQNVIEPLRRAGDPRVDRVRPLLEGLRRPIGADQAFRPIIAHLAPGIEKVSKADATCEAILEGIVAYRNAFEHPGRKRWVEVESRGDYATLLLDALLNVCECAPPTGSYKVVVVHQLSRNEEGQYLAGIAAMHGEFAEPDELAFDESAWKDLAIGKPFLLGGRDAVVPLHPYAAARKDKGRWDVGWMSGRASKPSFSYQASSDVFHMSLQPSDYQAVLGDGPVPDPDEDDGDITIAGGTPYRGLEAYEEEQAGLYFGREEEIDKAVAILKSTMTLILCGASGSGKSSFMKAGVVPALRKLPDGWAGARTIMMRPGSAPLASLRHELMNVGPEEQGDRVIWSDHVNTAIPRTGAVNVDRLAPIVDGLTPGRKRLVVCVDQLEEVATQCTDADERARFLDLFVALGTAFPGKVFLMAAIRADCIGLLLDHLGLQDLINADHLYTVGPIPPARLERVVVGPLHDAVQVEKGLVELILRDVGTRSGTLPMLSQLLKTLYEQRIEHGGRLTVGGYKDAGGLTGALAVQADAARKSVAQEDRDALDALLLLLVAAREPEPELEGPTQIGVLRRRVPLADAADALGRDSRAIQALIEPFVKRRLIVTGTQAVDEKDPIETIELAHEALATAWPFYSDLVGKRLEVLRIAKDLGAAETKWRKGEGDVWTDRNSSLSRAEQLIAEGKLKPTTAQREFLGDSRRAIAKRRRRAAALIGTIILVVSAGAIVSYFFYRDADKQRGIAEGERDRAEKFALVVTEQKEEADRQRETATALADKARVAAQEAIEATTMAEVLRGDAENLTRAARAEAFALRAERALGEGRASESLAYAAASLCLVADPLVGVLAAQARLSAAPCLWISPRMAGGKSQYVAFSASGRSFLVASQDMIRAWDTRTGLPGPIGSAPTPGPCSDGHLASVFGSDEGLVAEALGNSIILWEITDERPRPHTRVVGPEAGWVQQRSNFVIPTYASASPPNAKPDRPPPIITSLDLSRAKEILVAGFADGTVLAFKFSLKGSAGWKGVGAPLALGGPIRAVALDESGELCAVGGKDGIDIVEVGAGSVLRRLRDSPEAVSALAVATKNRELRVLAGYRSGEIAVWDLTAQDTPRRVLVKRGGRRVTTVLFDPSDPNRAFSCAGSSAQCWNLATGAAMQMACRSRVNAVTCSSDGKIVVTAEESSRGIRLWEASTGTERLPEVGHAEPVTSFGVDLATSTLASASLDGTIRFWDTATGEQRRVVREPEIADTAAEPRLLVSPDGRFGFCLKRWLEASMNDAEIDPWAMPPPPPPPVLLPASAASKPSGAPKPPPTFILLIFETSSGNVVAEVPMPYLPSTQIAFSRDGTTGAIGYGKGLAVIGLRGSPNVIATAWTDFAVTAVGFIGDSNEQLVLGSTDALVVVSTSDWKVRTKCTLPVWGFVPKVLGAISEEKVVCTGSTGHPLHVWNVQNDKQGPIAWSGHAGSVNGLATASPAGDFPVIAASCSQDGTALVWDVATNTILRRIETSVPVTAVALLGPDRLATGHADGTVRLWNVETGLDRFGEKSDKLPMSSIALSPSGHRLAAGFTDGTVSVWDLDKKARTNLVPKKSKAQDDDRPGIEHDARHAATAIGLGPQQGPRPDWVVCGYRSGRLSIWEKGSEIRVLVERGSPIMSIRFDLDGVRAVVLTASGVEIWNIHEQMLLISSAVMGCNLSATVACFSDDGKYVLCQDSGRFWALDATNLAEVRSEPCDYGHEFLTVRAMDRRTHLFKYTRITNLLGKYPGTFRHPNVLVDFAPVGLVTQRAHIPPWTQAPLESLGLFKDERKWHRAWDSQVRCPDGSKCQELCDLLGDWERTLGLVVDPENGEITTAPIPGKFYAESPYRGYCTDSAGGTPPKRGAPRGYPPALPDGMPPPPPPPPENR